MGAYQLTTGQPYVVPLLLVGVVALGVKALGALAALPQKAFVCGIKQTLVKTLFSDIEVDRYTTGTQQRRNHTRSFVV